MTEALRAIIEQTENKRLDILFRDIREKISQGAPTADALVVAESKQKNERERWRRRKISKPRARLHTAHVTKF